MSKPEANAIDELESAILGRAAELAAEISAKAGHQRDAMLRDARERLHRAEERATQRARSEAERYERRNLQASQLRLDGRIDQVRWELVAAVQQRLAERMQALREDRQAYRAWLVRMLAEAAALLDKGELHAEVIAQDLEWLRGDWDALVAEAAPDRTILLSEHATWGSGGVKLRNAADDAQVDNRFEGRLARMESEIQRVILERLFSGQINHQLPG